MRVQSGEGPTPPKLGSSGAVARPLDLLATTIALALCLSWGFNQVAVKLALPDVPPLIQSAIRSVGAGLLVALWSRARGIPLMARDGTLLPGITAGVLFALEFVLLYRGLLWTTASRAALFLYSAPFFVVLGTRWFLPADRFRLSQWIGLGLSFAGIVVAFGVPTPAADPRQMVGDGMIIGGAVAWAATTLVIKASALNRVSAEKTLLYQLGVSIPLLALGAIFLGERLAAVPSPLALGALGYQIVWVVSAIRRAACRHSRFSPPCSAWRQAISC